MNKNIIISNKNDPAPGPGVIQIYYYSSWGANTHIHYSANNGQWTPVPGVLMNISTNSTWPPPNFYVRAFYANTMQFVFTDGNGNWDHYKTGGNYYISMPGIYVVQNHDIQVIHTYPDACPGNPPCSNHGTCVNGTCDCQDGYYTANCSLYCNPDDHILCEDGTRCVVGHTCPPLPGCEIFTDGKCSGDEINMPDSFANRRWQTPGQNDPDYQSSFQYYNVLVGYADVKYSSDRKSATVNLIGIHKNSVTLTYEFDGQTQSSSQKSFDSSFNKPLTLAIYGADGSKLKLDPVDFMWNTHTPIVHESGDYRNGQKGSIIDLFGWPDEDIAQECESIGKMGYLGVKLFPHQEQLMSDEPFNDQLNPWYFYYQPVSYRLQGRHGTRDVLRQTIATCRSNKVRVYADAVTNHMVGSGNDMQYHRNSPSQGNCVYWPPKSSSASDVSPFYTQGFCYSYNNNTNLPPSQEFPAVPYGPLDFHCERPLNSWTSPLDLNAGWLTGLVDINTERENVQDRIAAYLTDLIGIGFTGLRIDAAKHIKPDDLVAIFTKLRTNLGGTFPDDFITWWEILLGGEADMLMCNENSGYNYGQYLVNKLQNAGFSLDDIKKIKIWNSGYPKEPDVNCQTDSLGKWRQVIQNDDHDQQEGGSSSRDMGDQGSVLVIDMDIPKHRYFEVKLFQDPNGVSDNSNECPIRNVLSSYYFTTAQNNVHAIPDGLSDCSLCKVNCDTCNTVTYTKAYQGDKCGYDGPVYTRVHRDKSIIMAMRAWMGLSTDVSNADIGIPDNCQ
ncbi:alpha-amylase [Anaeramoeba ignava]|uniref:Alpha-amylase n=1 Tax=Anaeramoeba ignava TaxID=1746090 RepID=A0A9Q0R9T8_ANAIG|nr:alpha-amylase [Anaeramoeba ignava]